MTTMISLKLQRQGEGRTHGGGVQSEDQSVILCDSMHPLTSPDLVYLATTGLLSYGRRDRSRVGLSRSSDFMCPKSIWVKLSATCCPWEISIWRGKIKPKLITDYFTYFSITPCFSSVVSLPSANTIPELNFIHLLHPCALLSVKHR